MRPAAARKPRRRSRRSAAARRRWRDRTRRAVNFLAAGFLIVLTAPAMLIVAVLIKVTSPGPVLYTQPRVGLDRRTGPADRRPLVLDGPVSSRRRVDLGGRIFTIYKFRTMRVDSDQFGQVWSTPGDPRVTGLGAVLRRYRLDELPQLFNILVGDMNLVGPRPEQPHIFAQLRRRIEHYPIRQRVLPGITGWAQVNHAYDQTLDDVRRKVDLDLEYLKRRSAIEDVRIMLRTVPVVILKRGSV